MVVVRVLIFGSARSLTGGEKERTFTWPDQDKITVLELVSHVIHRYPSLNALIDSMLIAVNMEYVSTHSSTVSLNEKDEIAFIPPLAGG